MPHLYVKNEAFLAIFVNELFIFDKNALKKLFFLIIKKPDQNGKE